MSVMQGLSLLYELIMNELIRVLLSKELIICIEYIYFSLLTCASLRSTKYNISYHCFIEYHCINIIVRERQLLLTTFCQ